MRRFPACLAAALVVAPLASRAQAPAAAPAPRPAANPQPAAAPAVAVPAGWQLRLDRPTAKTDALRFVTMGSGYHVTTGPSAIFYDPSMRAEGNFDVAATFTQTKAPMHHEAYGLLLGGSNLAGDAPDYLYFVVRGDGKYLIRHRAGAELHTLQEWTAHPAVRPADAAGKATNALQVRVGADSVRFVVNDAQVAGYARGGLMQAAGIVGLRVNHMLDVHVDGPRVTPHAAAGAP